MPHSAGTPKIQYQLAGSAGPRVLLVMGLGMGGALWEPQVRELCTDHQVATFDHRGIGQSDAPDGPFTIKDLAADALRVADALGWQTFHLVGISMGGMVAQEMVLAEPKRIHTLTLIATHPGGPTGILPRARGALWLLLSARGSTSFRIRALRNLLYPRDFVRKADGEALRERLVAQLTQSHSPRTTLLQILAVARHDTRLRLRSVTVPTLVVQPARDILVRPKHSAVLAKRIPGATLHAYLESGHGIAFQEAVRLSNDIRAHIARA